MGKKSFSRLLFIILAGFVLLAAGFQVLTRSAPSSGSLGRRGADWLPPERHIQFFGANPGQWLKPGDIIELRWENYEGSAPLSINGVSEGNSFPVATNLPATRSGVYRWEVPGGPTSTEAFLEIYPVGGREYVGRSATFHIEGSPYLKLTAPSGDVNVKTPTEFRGEARAIFFEGEFLLKAYYSIDGVEHEFGKTAARCPGTENECDWLSRKWVPFSATMDFASAPVCQLTMRAFAGAAKQLGKPMYQKVIHLHGSDACP